jgi:DEAD/DEAH box helicase domain-containing protein
MFIAPATASGEQFSYHEVNNWSVRPKRLAASPPWAAFQAVSSNQEAKTMVTFGSELLAAAVAGTEAGEQPLRHVAELPARHGRQRPWPSWVEPDVLRAFTDRGINSPWTHQVAAADLAHAGRHVVINTGTASGKSLAYQLPILNALALEPRARALYISPTKALGHDQLRTAHTLTAAIARLNDVAPTAYDGDSPTEVRRFARERSRWIFSNPDMVHLALLRNHARWAVFLRGLRFVVVDECHYYRGVFGSNVAIVLRRLLRLCARYSADPNTPSLLPTVIFASATTSEPGATAAELIGQPVEEITEDGSPQGARTVALWEPALRTDLVGENGAPVRRSAGSEAARVMADLIAEGARTLTFVRSRRGAELTALATRARLEDIAPELAEKVASYRAGYLPEDRNELERALLDGRLRGLATTNALELGIDIAGLDAVVLAGFPGTVTSFWQQAGRSGRRGQGALVVLVARDDPLDTYLVHNPAALLDKPIERVVIDPVNPYILGPQLLCAATELPLDDAEVRTLGAEDVTEQLIDDGLLRRRSGKYYPAPGIDPHPAVDIRGSSGSQIVIVESDTGRLLGTADTGRAAASVHPGAVYLHRGESYVVDSLDFDEGMAFVHGDDPGYATFARELTDIEVTGAGERRVFGSVTLGLVPVCVTNRIVGYLRRRLTGEFIDFVDLDMPPRILETIAVMYTITPEALQCNGIDPLRIPGSLHAAEHAAIGLLPLVASCDRGDIGGLSTAVGPEPAGLPSVFVYDGYPGGAGFAEQGFRRASTWLGATAAAIEACECPSGCPSCVQSPKCGNGNDPLDKTGAVRVLGLVLSALGQDLPTYG